MTYSVRAGSQVAEFIRQLAPEPRRAMRLALADLKDERGDLKALGGTFKGFHRVRVGQYRIIYKYLPNFEIEAVFTEDRDVVYERFATDAASRIEETPARFSWLKLAPRNIPRRPRSPTLPARRPPGRSLPR